MTQTSLPSAGKFDSARAGEYAAQSRIALAGYDACHELGACLLAADLGTGREARILAVGAGGTAQEIICAARLEPLWHFTAVDPSPPMLELAMSQVGEAGLEARTTSMLGEVEDLPYEAVYDGATLIGVLHHLPGDEAKQTLLKAVATRLKPGAPLILAGNRYRYASKPLFLAAWGERWRMHGASPVEIDARLGKILQGADPPASDEAVIRLVIEAGFEPPQQFFASLFWAGWITHRHG